MNFLRRCFVFVAAVLLSGSLTRAQMAGPGTALNLNGASSYAQAPNGVWFSNDFTVEGWVYPRTFSTNSWCRLIDFSDGPGTNNVYFALSFGTTGYPTMGVFTNNNGTPVLIYTNHPVPLNQWTHLAATLHGTTGTIYVNGIAVTNGVLNQPPAVMRTNNYIGRSAYSGDQYPSALFDELRIWNVARTAGHIQAWMHRSLVGNEAGLTAYWRMDEGSGATLVDGSTNGRNATVFGGISWSNSTIPMMAGPGSALNFNAAQTQSVDVPNRAALNAFPITVMTWFQVSPTNTGFYGGALVNKYNLGATNGYQIYLSGGWLYAMYAHDTANNVLNNGPMTAQAVNDGLWHNAAMVVDQTSGRLYLDGVLKGTVSWTGTPQATTTTSDLNFGNYPGNSFFSGQIDEVSVWNTALTATQIQAAMNKPLMGNEPGLVSCWQLDEGSGTNVFDATANGFNGTLKNSPTWLASEARIVAPDPGYGIYFNGSSNYVKVPNGIWFSNAFTIEGWVYAESIQNWARLLDFNDGPSINEVYLGLSQGETGYPVLGVLNNNNSSGLEGSTQLPLQQWAHLAATFDGANGAIYINGVLSGSGPISLTPNNVLRTNNWIGQSPFTSDSYPNAVFDEIRVWNVARTQSQIQAGMGHPLLGSESGLIGYWRLDDGTGTNAIDATGNGNTATLINGPTWQVSGAGISLTPFPITLAVTDATGATAALVTQENPNGLPTTLYFLYGTTPSFGSTNPLSIGNGYGPVMVTNVISGLSVGTDYYCQVLASNSFGVTASIVQNFEPSGLPIVTTQPATYISSVSATLNGTVLPNGSGATAWLQYGVDTNYGSLTLSTFIDVSNTSPVAVSEAATNLNPGYTYHFSMVASNIGGVSIGADMTFTPPPLPPVISGEMFDFTEGAIAQVTAFLQPYGADTTVWIEYGPDTNYGSNVDFATISGTNLNAVQLNSAILNLTVGATYHFQFVATNSAGTNYGGDLTFHVPVFVQDQPLPDQLANGSVAWGDFDNDGLLDLLICGTDSNGNVVTQVWRNTGNGFTNINAGITGIYNGTALWGDFDNDGLLDILICGEIFTTGNQLQYVTQLWRNTGNGFTNINANLPNITGGTIAVGDFDNDGRLDILFSGVFDYYAAFTQVWRNTGNGFTNMNAGLPGIYGASVAVGDFDNDGRLDVVLAGFNSNYSPVTQVWRNTGNGFTNINAGLPGVYYGTVSVGDYDNDGRLDILFGGYDANNNPTTQLWHNTGGAFTNVINSGLPNFLPTSMAWGDYDGDGQLDLLLSGAGTNNEYGNSVPFTQVWRNTGNGGFTLAEDLDLNVVEDYFSGSAAWGDYNKDGRLELVVEAEDITGFQYSFTALNQTPATNTPPGAPSGLYASMAGSTLTLNWQASTDLQTPPPGLSYNLRVGSSPGASDILASTAATNGLRRVAQRGNIQQHQLTLELNPAPVPGTMLYWSVQGIDTSFAGSSFAPEASLLVRPFFNTWGFRADGSFQAGFNVFGGTNYSIEASTDLIHWTDLFDFNFDNSGPVTFSDPGSTNYPHRFYRFGQH